MRSFRSTGCNSLRIGLVFALALAAACSDSTGPKSEAPSLARGGQQGPDFHAAIAAQSRHQTAIMSQSGVEGIGVGLTENGKAAVVIMTANAAVSGLPNSLDGVPVKVMPTGPFSAVLPSAKPDGPGNGHGGGGGGGGGTTVDPTAAFPRPVPLGVSIGNENECAAGTLGARVTKGGSVFILSNNHVLARQNAGSPGEDILQPGRFDTSPQCSLPADGPIGALSQFVTISLSGTNTVDAALASTTTGNVGNATYAGGYGVPSSTTRSASVNMAVQKCGRTTGCTHGTVSAINATINVQYDFGVATFVNQVVVAGAKHKAFSGSGDSGSLIVTDDANANPVALLFAGSRTTTIGNPINAVLSALGVTIDGK
jgi:hypothetical protein